MSVSPWTLSVWPTKKPTTWHSSSARIRTFQRSRMKSVPSPGNKSDGSGSLAPFHPVQPVQTVAVSMGPTGSKLTVPLTTPALTHEITVPSPKPDYAQSVNRKSATPLRACSRFIGVANKNGIQPSGLACLILSSPWPATFIILPRNNAKTAKTGGQRRRLFAVVPTQRGRKQSSKPDSSSWCRCLLRKGKPSVWTPWRKNTPARKRCDGWTIFQPERAWPVNHDFMEYRCLAWRLRRFGNPCNQRLGLCGGVLRRTEPRCPASDTASGQSRLTLLRIGHTLH